MQSIERIEQFESLVSGIETAITDKLLRYSSATVTVNIQDPVGLAVKTTIIKKSESPDIIMELE